MSYGLNVEMQKQTEVAMRLNSIIGQVLPLLSQDHQQAVASVVQRAKQVTMSDLNSSIGYCDLTSGALSYETLEMHKQSEIAKRLNDIILQLLPFLSLETQQQVTASIERAKQSPISELNSSIGQQMYSQGGIPQGAHGNLSMAPHPSSGAMQGGSAASSSGSPGLLSAGSQASSMGALSPLSMASFSKPELAQQEEKRNRAEAEKQQTNMEERAYQEMAYGINAETHKQIEIAKRLNAIFYQTLPYLSQGHQQQMVAAVERAKQVTMTELSSLIGYYEMSHGFSVEMHKHAEIAKRIHGLIAQVLPFLSQEHQMQIAASVDRAKQVTMAELNFIMGGLSGVTRSEDVSSRRKPSNTGE